MLVTSRSFDEYVAMFGFDESQLPSRVLDCSAGAAGFVAEAAARGVRPVACDPAYRLSRSELAELAAADLARGNAIAAAEPDRFVWDWYGVPARREEMRRAALAAFVTDHARHPEHYVAGELPRLPLRDATFDVAVCSHLLFTWAETLDAAWHLAALRELARVATEVRVFPTVQLGRGDPVPFFDDVLAGLAADGLLARVQPVGYEFQVGANRMLVVTR